MELLHLLLGLADHPVPLPQPTSSGEHGRPKNYASQSYILQKIFISLIFLLLPLTSCWKLLGLPQLQSEEGLRKRRFSHLEIKTLVEGRLETFEDCVCLFGLAHFHPLGHFHLQH